MAIVNRDLDVSEQREVFQAQLAPVSLTGGTYMIALVPSQIEVQAIEISADGLSNVPVFEVEAHKFAGGITINSSICTGTSVGAFGLSGPVSLALGTAGSTQVQVDAGSALVLSVTGANSAAAKCVVTVVGKRLQDIVTHFGV